MNIKRARGTLNGAGQAVELRSLSLHINLSIGREVRRMSSGIATTARSKTARLKIHREDKSMRYPYIQISMEFRTTLLY